MILTLILLTVTLLKSVRCSELSCRRSLKLAPFHLGSGWGLCAAVFRNLPVKMVFWVFLLVRVTSQNRPGHKHGKEHGGTQ